MKTEGSLGAGGSVTSSADIRNVNASGVEMFTATSLKSTRTASENGVSGSTTIGGGVVQTSEGDPDIGGDETYVSLPPDPAPNTEVRGRLETVGDTFRYIFNEQATNPDGSLTVYAAHLDMIGPTAVGERNTAGARGGQCTGNFQTGDLMRRNGRDFDRRRADHDRTSA